MKHSRDVYVNDRHGDRLALGDAAVISLSRAVQLLPWNDAESRKWLKSAGLVRLFGGRTFVIWSEVIAELKKMPLADANESKESDDGEVSR